MERLFLHKSFTIKLYNSYMDDMALGDSIGVSVREWGEMN
jgi:hypothetical protein